jgi:hypothetical protein
MINGSALMLYSPDILNSRSVELLQEVPVAFQRPAVPYLCPIPRRTAREFPK